MSKPKKVKIRPVTDAVFVYVSACHSAQAKKAALTMPDGVGIGRELGHVPKTENIQGLGGWRCSECNRPCKVSRSRKQTRFELNQ
jgi:hypothetical protein